jgi:hypothetical protein
MTLGTLLKLAGLGLAIGAVVAGVLVFLTRSPQPQAAQVQQQEPDPAASTRMREKPAPQERRQKSGGPMPAVKRSEAASNEPTPNVPENASAKDQGGPAGKGASVTESKDSPTKLHEGTASKRSERKEAPKPRKKAPKKKKKK